jgi:fluoroquinolone transport system permease protein
VNGLRAAMRLDVMLQARNGFYWATLFLVLVVGGLLTAIPEAARADRVAWVPAIVAANLQITTFFFVAGLMLLDRDQGVLGALAVSPLSPGSYLGSRTITLTALAIAETVALVWIGFGPGGSWPLILFGSAALGVIYTGLGAVVGVHYRSVNALLLPAWGMVTALLLPLLPHFALAPRALFLLHPVEPPLTLIRAGYGSGGPGDVAYGLLGSLAWSAVAFAWGRSRVARLMHDAGAGES